MVYCPIHENVLIERNNLLNDGTKVYECSNCKINYPSRNSEVNKDVAIEHLKKLESVDLPEAEKRVRDIESTLAIGRTKGLLEVEVI